MKKLALIGMLVTAFTLASCGGSNSPPTNLVIPGSPQNYLSTPTYVQGTDEYNAFMAINAFRFSVGLGYWQQNVYLDQAAQKHMAYSTANSAIISNPYQQDIEIVGNPSYFATTPSARAIALGYYVMQNTTAAPNGTPFAAVGELYALGPASSPTSTAILNSMVNTIYHRSGLMAQSTREIGLARDTSGPATALTHWWISHGRLDGGQSVASNYFAVYPNNQLTNVPLSMTMESPSVYPAYTTPAQFNANTSSPISVTTAIITNLNNAAFTVTVAGSSTPLAGKTWTMANDPNLNTSSYSAATAALTTPPAPVPTIAANEAFWVGNAPFLPNTTYNVTFTGSTYLMPYAITNNVSQTWQFTTGTSTGN
ncbi:hypothetical protein [Solimicrobium silvestre]|uniref:Cysteine-rich secretory protein family n=1 Tax=Solimicrobium silvestre TaxID=2099400 RepID=A0A2S9GUD9_9BURK|nr:hypothetical protein [Solimicrobium silvestre]PRC91329.1 hypothetical protein S2091_4000 [Solimicrobium silvestre]